MKLPRRQFLHLGAAALPAVSRIARAQSYPSRPITIIVPYSAGGPTDTVGRVMAERMRDLLGQPVVVENVTGAAGSIGTNGIFELGTACLEPEILKSRRKVLPVAQRRAITLGNPGLVGR